MPTPAIGDVIRGLSCLSFNQRAALVMREFEGRSLAEIAVALKATKVILLTDVEGVLGGDGKVIPVLSREEARKRIDAGEVTGGMIPKVEACIRALDAVPLAHIVDGRTKHALLLELFTEAGIGTMVTQ